MPSLSSTWTEASKIALTVTTDLDWLGLRLEAREATDEAVMKTPGPICESTATSIARQAPAHGSKHEGFSMFSDQGERRWPVRTRGNASASMPTEKRIQKMKDSS
jgi:hypothetical protein